MEKIRLGVSTCLLGEKVRYDGNHKHDPYITKTLSQWVEYVPVCPEYECGLGVPREPMRLVGDRNDPRLVTIKTGVDLTERMKKWSAQRLEELEAEELSGYIFKSKSPSSGLYRVKVFNAKGMPEKVGTGIFARAFTEKFPFLPVEEEGRLHDPFLREQFIERIFVMHRWRVMQADKPTLGQLVEFHTRHKLLIMAHSPKHYRELGKMVAAAKGVPRTKLFQEYLEVLNHALSLKPTARKHVNVMQHIMGYFKKSLTSDEKKELLEVFDTYRRGDVPLIVPVTLLNHFVRKFEEPYLAQQFYLSPHPIELRLRNHA